ncbi:MAG: phosphodiester glycosidase family protein [Chitinophagaceae bacterium]|nr:phosphodiester glycosidase family protein [Anaerolineae bacterium]
MPEMIPTVGVDAEWEMLAPGLEQRVYLPSSGLFSQIVVLRIDPTLYSFRAHYRPGQPLNLNQWQAELPNTTAFVNANFFEPNYEISGLLIADSIVYGQAYQNRGGTFAVQGGVPIIRSNIAVPYSGEAFEQAVQAFPMLITDGLQSYTSDAPDRVTRRTAIGQDAQGRILLMATPLLGLTLLELSTFLASSDMQLINAFNLDGGGSTMMAIAPAAYMLSSIDPVPAVLAVYPR